MMALEASLRDVAQLRTEAQQVNAGPAMMFFTGLHSLLTVVAKRRVFLAAVRVESVKARSARDGRRHPPVGGAWADPACRD